MKEGEDRRYMREIGGYMEVEHYEGKEYHTKCISLNTGRNCLRYLLRARKIRKIALPEWLCSAVSDVCEEEKVEIIKYSTGWDFLPESLSKLDEDFYLYLVNYYGQLPTEFIENTAYSHSGIILDNAQAFFEKPLPGIDTLYTCRKFFGVADGAYLYTDCIMEKPIEKDKSYQRIGFLAGRYERSANEFYAQYLKNEELIAGRPIQHMSRLTENILKSIDYISIAERRKNNFLLLHQNLKKINQLKLKVPDGAFAYPLYVPKGGKLRKRLQESRIYVPTLWPNVLNECARSERAWEMTDNILPLPCDQRYSKEDMRYMTECIFKYLED